VARGQEPEAAAPAARVWAGGLLRQPRIRIVALIALAVAIFAIAWAVVTSSPFSGSNTVVPIRPVGLSASGLQTLAAVVPQPIYWAGPKPGYLYELTRTREGNVYIRYLPPRAAVGAKGAKYMVIGTYPRTKAFDSLKKVANGREIGIPGGGIALVDTNPRSVHLAYPGVDYQVEVYDPSPARSLEVARSGAVRPVH
jgi:hypothetical protein